VFLNSKGKNKDRTEPIKLIHNRLSCNNQLRKIKNKKEVENLNSTTTQTSLKETKNWNCMEKVKNKYESENENEK